MEFIVSWIGADRVYDHSTSRSSSTWFWRGKRFSGKRRSTFKVGWPVSVINRIYWNRIFISTIELLLSCFLLHCRYWSCNFLKMLKASSISSDMLLRSENLICLNVLFSPCLNIFILPTKSLLIQLLQILLKWLYSTCLNHFCTLQPYLLRWILVRVVIYLSSWAVSWSLMHSWVVCSVLSNRSLVMVDRTVVGSVITKLFVQSYFAAEIEQVSWKLIVVRIWTYASVLWQIGLLTLICIYSSTFNNTFNIRVPSIIKVMTNRHICVSFSACRIVPHMLHDFVGSSHRITITFIEDFTDTTLAFQFLFQKFL